MSLESRICREQTPRQGVKGNSANFKGFWPGLLVNRVQDLVEIFEPLCQQEVCLGKKSSKKVNQNTNLAMQYSGYEVFVYETYQKKTKSPSRISLSRRIGSKTTSPNQGISTKIQ